mmetsp:Transcript_42443/g.89122  ORF Transcript_42443/g.89122 Transcript_42443/m.89122 type:complete len:1576 (-) Transcript_42443:115-4842(-)
MGKKKKASQKRNDARGYTQGGGGAPPPSQQHQKQKQKQPSSSSSSSSSTNATTTGGGGSKQTKSKAPSVSTKTHDDMKELLGQLDTTPNINNSSSSSTTTVPPSDRFASKLTNILANLDSLQFAHPQIERAVLALQYDITLEKALDWLCLNLSTLELPALFTEGGLRRDLREVTTAESLTVLPQQKQKQKQTKKKEEEEGGAPEKNDIASENNVLDVGHRLKLLSSSKNDDNAENNGNGGSREAKRNEVEENKEENAQHKKWLLQQYQYEEDEEEDNNNNNNDNGEEDEATIIQSLNIAGASSPTNNAAKAAATTTEATATTTEAIIQTPEEQQLITEEQILATLQADLANDANNYMRSKFEIKQLTKEVKVMKQKVAGLRKKVERHKKALQRRQQMDEPPQMQQKQGEEAECKRTNKSAVVDETEEEEEEEYGGGFFDMFAQKEDDDDDNENEETTATDNNAAQDATKQSATTTTKQQQQQLLYNLTIPNDWTGSTPQKKLEELLKKKKLPRARYTKLPRKDGFALSIVVAATMANPTKQQQQQRQRQTPQQQTTTRQKKWEANTNDFQPNSSLKDYLAMRALYEMDPSLPLYHVFPPKFREMWLSWVNAKREEEDAARRVTEDAKRERLDRLLGLIAGMRIDHRGRRDGVKRDDDGHLSADGAYKQKSMDDNDIAINDNWDDDDDDVDDNESLNVNATAKKTRTGKSSTRSTTTTKGEKLRTDFLQNQSTPAYQTMKSTRDRLPMTSFRSTILETVQTNPVTILCAETGAGKSTQCAQYILERAFLDGRADATSILCTQPRRVAATTLAERVSQELSLDGLGNTVGYQIRMEAKRSARTKLLFCTTGIVLRRLQEDRTLAGITHVICDEVHERTQQMDVLLIILRQLLRTTRPDLKIVLMSATMETQLFREFFMGAPTISVPGRTFPVASYHLEDLLDATDHIIEEGSRCAYREEQRYGETASLWVTTRGGEKRKEMVDLTSSQVEPLGGGGGVSDLYRGYKMSTRRSMERVNEEIINYDLMEDVLKLIVNENHDGNRTTLMAPDGVDMSEGSILIFLPGLGEIRALIERLEGSRVFRDSRRFDLIPLHSTLSSRDQRRAFLPSRPGCRKIICATNIAETSVTLPDVVYVIDTGRVREVRRNKRTSASMLVMDWCPRSSAKQRQGRAGRVQPGVCLKLYSSATAESVMKATNEPELRRVPLEEVCMSILASGYATNCMEFLDQAPQPPTKESVQAAMNVLREVGAVERVDKDGMERQSESDYLTPLGFHLAKLPVDVKLGKMLIFGALFRCIDPILTIAASLSSKSPFAAFISDAAVAKAKQRVFEDADSDFMTFCNVWDAFFEAAKASASAGRKFCQENYLNHVALREIGDARRQFFDLLCGIGFVERNAVMGNSTRYDPRRIKSCHFNRHAKKAEVVHTVICAGLYPNILRLDQSASMSYSLWHKEERIYFHRASVNSIKKRFSNSEHWVVFHEKFGTPNRTSVSTTAFVHPFALILFSRSVAVKHTERVVRVDDWMTIGMPAQTGVMLRELRKKEDAFLHRMIECTDSNEIDQNFDSCIIDGIINILSHD